MVNTLTKTKGQGCLHLKLLQSQSCLYLYYLYCCLNQTLSASNKLETGRNERKLNKYSFKSLPVFRWTHLQKYQVLFFKGYLRFLVPLFSSSCRAWCWACLNTVHIQSFCRCAPTSLAAAKRHKLLLQVTYHIPLFQLFLWLPSTQPLSRHSVGAAYHSEILDNSPLCLCN